MPYNPRTPGKSAGFSLNTNHGLAVLVLVALVILFALRHVFGTIAVSAGTK